MPSLASTRLTRVGSAIAVSLVVAACGGGGSSSAARPRCGTSALTSATWVGGAGWIGAGVAVVGIGYYGGWYDPGDGYDPATGVDYGYYGDDYGDGNGDNGNPPDPPDDDAPDAPGTPADDTAGGDTSGDSSGGGDSSGDPSTDSLRPRTLTTANATDAVNGCWTCTVGCTATDATGQRAGRQAIGVSDVSYNDACRSGVRSIGGWAHDTLRQRLTTCQQADPNATPRVAASPSVTR